MSPCVSTLLFVLLFSPVFCQYTITIHPEYLAQNGRTHFEADRYDGHNGLDNQQYLSHNHAIGSESGRWLNGDLNGDTFTRATENPHRKGYPDPNHFNSYSVQQSMAGKYKDNLNAYGKDLDLVMCLNGRHWPHWMDTSHHGGIFPNNLDAGAELATDMLAGIQKYTGGIIPPFFEVMNEPDGLYQNVDWSRITEFHKVLAAKLKAKFPKIKVGGPTYTGAINSADKHDFRVWKMIRQFLDMSLYHLDFFSFHPYSSFHSHGNTHAIRGTNEARLVAIIDLVESYSNMKKGVSVPLIPSEYGLGGKDVDGQTSKDLIRWGYAYLNNAYMFTYLNHRDVIDQTVAFILSHTVPAFEDADLFTLHGEETFITSTYRFWKHLSYNQQFLRIESQYNGQERTISPLVLADSHTKQFTVLLHNYKQSSTQVKLDFKNYWLNPSEGKSTCIYLDNKKTPHFSESQSVHMNNHILTVPSEASCFYTFQTSHNFAGTPTVQEKTRYAKAQALPIHNNVVQTTINVGSGNFHSAQLRFGVSTSNKGAHTTPKSVSVNGHLLTGHYSLYDADRPAAETLWDMFVYDVPTNVLKQGDNEVKLTFAQSGGYVSTAAMLVGTLSGDGHVVG